MAVLLLGFCFGFWLVCFFLEFCCIFLWFFVVFCLFFLCLLGRWLLHFMKRSPNVFGKWRGLTWYMGPQILRPCFLLPTGFFWCPFLTGPYGTGSPWFPWRPSRCSLQRWLVSQRVLPSPKSYLFWSKPMKSHDKTTNKPTKTTRKP